MRVLVIAEAGVNHNGDIELAKRLVHEAAAAGADVVKFQTFKAERLASLDAPKADYQKQTTGDSVSQFDMLRELELTPGMHEELIACSKDEGIRFLSTAFDTLSLEYLDSLGAEYIKIPSGEITNLPYLRLAGSLGKPVLLSTGMSTLGDIEAAIDVLETAGTPRSLITVLHCNTEYPTPMADVNLRAMGVIKDAFGVATGYSDHTLGIEVPIAAVALGAVVIEKHLTLDRGMQGPDHRASLEPHDFAAMVKAIRNIEAAMGDGVKRPSPSERKNIVIARKSLVLARGLKQGESVAEGDLDVKRPGDGISPMRMDRVVGRRAVRDLPSGYKLDWTDLL
jgi:N,N'-diacetyllegionaminate synthase